MVWLTMAADFVDLASKNSFKKEQAFEDFRNTKVIWSQKTLADPEPAVPRVMLHVVMGYGQDN